MNLPRARRDDLLVTSLDDEVVVYDPVRKQAHSLNRVALAVWNHADGKHTIEDLTRLVADETASPTGEAAVRLALRKLERAHLLLNGISTADAMTRRDALRTAGRFGLAAMVATPMIASTMVPAAAAASSVCRGPIPGSSVSAPCGSTCQCLKTMTPTGPGAPKCVDYTQPTITLCGTLPGKPFSGCPAGQICVEVDSSQNLGICYGACARPTCTC